VTAKIVSAVLTLIAVAAGAAFFLAGILMKREFKGYAAGLIAVPILSVAGVVLELVILIVSVLVTDIASKNF
jgi:hypothetical protein